MSRQAELKAIGCILYDNNVIGKCPYLSAEMFTDDLSRTIFQKSLELLRRSKKVSYQTLATVCADKIDKLELEKILANCVQSIGYADEIGEYAADILEDYRAGQYGAFLKQVNGEKISSANISRILRDTNSLIERLQVEDGNEIISSGALAKEYQDKRFTPDRNKYIYLGFPNLDEYVGGLEGGDMAVLAARPGVGKSALSVQLITNFCRKGMRVGYYNLEMPPGQIYDRFICHLSGIELNRIKTATAFKPGEEEMFASANKAFADMKLELINGKNKISDIRYSCRYKKYDIVIIDYLQLVRADTQYKSRREEVGEISKSVKQIAMENKIPVIVLSQLNRVNDETKEPSMSDLRESGDIEQDASVIIMLWNKNKDRTEKGVKVEKNRQGKTGTGQMNFDGSRMRFTEVNTRRSQTVKAEFEDVDDDCPFT